MRRKRRLIVSRLEHEVPREVRRGAASRLALLGPLGAAVAIISALVIAVLVLGLSVKQPALGKGPVCASLPVLAGPGAPVPHAVAQLLGLAPGSTGARAGPVEVCTDHPSALVRLAGVLGSLPSAVLALGALLIARRWFKFARQPGRFYTRETAYRLKVLGWYLTIGSVAVSIIESAANAVVITTLARHVGWAPAELRLSVVTLTLVIGLILIGFSHVIADGAAMRGELEDAY
jgi:hypothetical protein